MIRRLLISARVLLAIAHADLLLAPMLEVRRLRRRVDELERRVSELEIGVDVDVDDEGASRWH